MKAVSWKMSQGEDGLPVIAIEGSIVETSNLQGLLAEVPQKATLDLYGVDYINSAGTREWINFLTLVSEAGKEVSFVRCSVAFVRLFNIVANVAEKYHIASIMAPYVCPDCDHEDVKVIELVPLPPT